MDFQTLKQIDNANIANTYARFDIGIVSGKGAVCIDTTDKEYIDFSSGIGVNALGFCNDKWAQAVATQAATLSHTSNLFYTQPGAQLAQKLCKRTGMKKVFFGNSGAEANEGAIKAARKYSRDKYGEDRFEIITLYNSFHGRTIATLSATGQDALHTHFDPFLQGFVYTKANDIPALHAAVSEKTCAVMLELIQGEGGVIPLEPEFVDAVAKLCAQRDLLLIIDEVQTGMGRTGSLFCYEQFALQPDIVTCAKGLGGGLPIGAVLLGEKCETTLGTGDHGSTFGANPIVTAGASVVLDALTDELLQEVKEKGAYIKKRLTLLPRVLSITGMGLMLGITFDGIIGRDVVNKCLQRGVIFLTAKNKLRMLPPLIISYEQIDSALDILQEVLIDWED